MGTESNMAYYQENARSSFHHPFMVSFQPGAMDASGTASGSAMIDHLKEMTPCPTGLIISKSMLRFMHVSGATTQWSDEETEKLDAGLIMYANEPNIRKYAKIATTLPRKTIRDVALRCQWIISKESGTQPKMDEYLKGNNIKHLKGKMVCSSSAENIRRTPSPVIYEMKNLIVENDRILRDIARNLKGGMVQQNIRLFVYLRNNITKIENSISEISSAKFQIPWSMRQIPPFPLSEIDEMLVGLTSLSGNGESITDGPSIVHVYYRKTTPPALVRILRKPKALLLSQSNDSLCS